jgi:hypothetical protein
MKGLFGVVEKTAKRVRVGIIKRRKTRGNKGSPPTA